MVKFALIIAIPQYDNFKPLPKTTQDGETIAQQLRTYGDYRITRLPAKGNADTADYEMKAGRVTVDQLYDTLKLFLNEIAKGQAALIYFTGHGFTCDRFDEQEGFLATSNTQVTVENKKIVDQTNGFPLTRLASLIQKANLSELVLLLDCCHSGNFIETRLMRGSLKTFEHKQNYYLITACRSYETAKSIRKDEHSVFSGAVIEGLSSQNADEQGKISCDRLFDYINTQIGGKLQSPLRMGIGGSISLVKHPLTATEEVTEIEPIRDSNGEIICPYQGLNVFKAEKKAFFFGRKRLTEDIKQKLDEPLYEIIQRQAIYMPPLEGMDLQDTILKPAQCQGFKLDNDLLLQLLDDVGKEQGFLPLLEFALTLLWEKRDKKRKVLTLQAYQRLGEERSPLAPLNKLSITHNC